MAIEIKGAARVDKNDFNNISVFADLYSPKKNIIVCNEKEKRKCGKINVFPWRVFLNDLWEGKII